MSSATRSEIVDDLEGDVVGDADSPSLADKEDATRTAFAMSSETNSKRTRRNGVSFDFEPTIQKIFRSLGMANFQPDFCFLVSNGCLDMSPGTCFLLAVWLPSREPSAEHADVIVGITTQPSEGHVEQRVAIPVYGLFSRVPPDGVVCVP
jgi:hypothetical protein